MSCLSYTLLIPVSPPPVLMFPPGLSLPWLCNKMCRQQTVKHWKVKHAGDLLLNTSCISEWNRYYQNQNCRWNEYYLNCCNICLAVSQKFLWLDLAWMSLYIVSWYKNDGNLMRILNLLLIFADHIFKQNEAMWLAELNISAIYDQLMKLNFLSLIFLRPINSRHLVTC